MLLAIICSFQTIDSFSYIAQHPEHIHMHEPVARSDSL